MYSSRPDVQRNQTSSRGERPLGEKLPDGIEVEDNEGETWTLTGAIELHRLVIRDDYNQLEKRTDEITSTIIDYKCSVDDDYKEVSQLPLPLLPRSRHCSSPVIWETLKQRSCS